MPRDDFIVPLTAETKRDPQYMRVSTLLTNVKADVSTPTAPNYGASETVQAASKKPTLATGWVRSPVVPTL